MSLKCKMIFSHPTSFLCYYTKYLFMKKTFYVKENGIDLSIVNAIESIVQCLRSEEQYCVNVPDEGVSMNSLGM